jgi:alginate O-acetyltransferase complex protein AlgI
MVFSSYVFLYCFLPAALLLYFLTPKPYRSVTLVASSIVFYGWCGPQYAALMLFSCSFDYWCGGRIAAARERGERGKRWLVLSVCVELGLLGFFKYANFAVETLNDLRAAYGAAPLRWDRIDLPPGISFYTFQTMSYVIDVYRGEARRARSFVDFAAYVTMFPQLVAGPIVRYVTVQEQLRERTHTSAKFAQGVAMLQAGLAKKLLVADVLAPVANAAFDGGALGPLDAWIGLLAYTFQIYFDFSGYSDMAIGLGLMLGFRFAPNFDRPYAALGVTDFWRRWHLSLSTWLRDNLYVPLGGNRKGPTRTYVNLAATMLLGGLWHGANWTFVAWGAYQGAWLIVERLLGKRTLFGFAPKPVQIALAFVVTMGGWVFFRAPSLDAALAYFGYLFGSAAGTAPAIELRPIHAVAFAAAAVVVWGFPTTQRLAGRLPGWWIAVLQPLFLAALLQLHLADHVPFLYYQF